MVRGKTQMKRIENATSRQVTFSKRRSGLLKKAFELSILCDAEVALIIFSPRGKLYEFASSSMQATLERYEKHTKDNQANNKSVASEQNVQRLQHEATSMMKEIENLEVSKRKLLGESLGVCTVEELQEVEQQLEKSVNSIRARKTQVFKEQIEQLREKERVLTAENERLTEKARVLTAENERLTETCGAMQLRQQVCEQRENLASNESSTSSDVETELYIGPPDRRTKH
ncbi:MADS-box protein SOC1 isoform X1 [Argentina anserina]|uniref:MADS-box protein SOC1 isoform X1 n=1 Tax=Argentina anserina TaxID=57926 RepID=UPI0021766FE3|nr:MADS-box protein SOC1 isoform X1 [Potentilla anserina]XP_050385061.1 MADS-box protein SOC1 isoform X1 [Potentilla anserina]XP_050385062.1 MADS-box protein SOC1 isoform X1 [Potentilla anserina]XP_050385063.1 MADS-box protein SOC1 isoform X1 [Potentilla anserina]XP_050385064.1 MADS-box protein SOC1 isoform X1 [Potentilla anserina]